MNADACKDDMLKGWCGTNEVLFPYTLAVAPFRSLYDIIVALRWDPCGFFEVSESQQNFLFGIRYFVQYLFGVAETLHNELMWWSERREKAKLETYPSKILPLMKTMGKDVKDVEKPTGATSVVNSGVRA
ncbi:hypothetical protein NE237_015011 [Protea cynaroides]|uniref:Uncharacterized protein n=1 Tax=Protea cynaroides TaxID=273540 RepID=A0A9Q0QQN4_9MAGN|nr:hypothetical protein NE237_015011 [Protea cynaroides]